MSSRVRDLMLRTAGELRHEPTEKRVRAMVGDHVAVDSTRVVLVEALSVRVGGETRPGAAFRPADPELGRRYIRRAASTSSTRGSIGAWSNCSDSHPGTARWRSGSAGAPPLSGWPNGWRSPRASTTPAQSSGRRRKRFRAEIESGRIQVVEASVEAIPFEDASFDRVLSVHTIYFWPDAERGLREILRVLKPAGRLVLATDAKAPPRAIAKHGFNAYTAGEQTGLLGRAGFTDVSVERRGAQLFAQGARPA